MARRTIKGSVTVVTGASSGIGLAAARLFARSGARVVLAARDEARLRRVAAEIRAYPAEVLVASTDVTSDDQVAALARRTIERFGRIDIMICNAGVGLYGQLADLPIDALRKAFEVNFYGVVRCVQAVVPIMRRQAGGLIQIISSVVGRRAIPGYGGYCSTKFALYGLAEALRGELRGTGVSVQTVYPSLTDTAFADNAIAKAPGPRPMRIRPMPAEKVAEHMLRAARHGCRDHMVTWSGRLLALVNGIAPGALDAIISRLMKSGSVKAHHALPDRRQ